ncbi:nose resistant to fluoxetine protein 6-like [Drosophila albomicans]|uniref:Nose resistant to fluoxetine protein 6-like n=1 Tax=Drosophila albomicans TaxID=7291 RepID=A0A9C6SVY7_DROAB|nr:nose resistant to fluoxetine protein 6-like [Drosophila albomicans]
MFKIIVIGTLLFCGLTQVCSNQFEPSGSSVNNEEYQRLMELRPFAVQLMQQFGNITQTDLDLRLDNRLPNQQDLLCLADMAQLMSGLSSRSYWALRMIDSWGSIPSGILYGNFFDMGNYDECIKTYKAITDSHSIRGKYCFAKISFRATLKIAVCFPSSCSAELMDTFIGQIANRLLNVTITKNIVDEATCSTAEKEPFDAATILIIVILSVLAAAMILATLCDYFICRDQNKLPIIIKAFSARANSRALFRLVEPKSNPNVIDCVHGMRCLSLIWVIFGHQYIVSLSSPKTNYVSLLTWLQSFFASFILHGPFSVDTFFFLSGLLLVMIALRSLEKSKGQMNIPMMYLHRYLRLTPVLALAIPMYMKLLPLMSDGPVTDRVNFGDFDVCKRTWYLSLLYVQNYATKEICLGHTWYLAVDMQLYILSPIFLISLYKWGKKAAGGIFVLMLLLSGCLFATMMTNKYGVFLDFEGQRKLYYATHVHAAPWLIGLLFGYFLHLNRNKSFKLIRISIWLGWIVSLALLFTSLFALYPAAQSDAAALTILEQAFYYTLTRIAWPLSLCWVVFACMKGYGGLADSFLSSPLWQPLSRLSYSAYIYHVYIQLVNDKRVRSPSYLSDYDMMLSFWGTFSFTVLMAYVMHIILEAPLGALEGILLSQRRPKQRTEVLNKTQADTS